MGLFDFLKHRSRPSNEISNPPATPNAGGGQAKSQTTSIEREHFSLQAPFEWKFVRSENSLEFEFRNQTLPEQLIVTVLLTKALLSVDQLKVVGQQLMGTRLKALEQLGATGRVVSQQVGSGQFEIRGIARDETNKVRCAWVIRVAPAKAVTVALTRYMLEDIGLPFEMYAGSIFDFVQVKNLEQRAGSP